MRHFSSKIAALALVFSGATQANMVDLGTYSVDYTASSHLAIQWLDGFGGLYFSMGGNSDWISGDPNLGYFYKSGSIAANFHAPSGKVFDKLFFSGTTGLFARNEAGGVNSKLDWTISGHTFVGDTTYGGFHNPPGRTSYVHEWTITGPSTGTAVFGKNDVWYNYTTESGVAGSGYYDIGVADFSIDVDSLITITAGLNSNGQGVSQWGSTMSVPGVTFAVSFRDAPLIINGVPEPDTYALLLTALGVLGVTMKRRTAK